jgi:nucleotide-binding universal stress UspA family protein
MVLSVLELADPPLPAISPARAIATLLLATDLTPASAGAERLALSLARDLRCSVLVVSVIDPHPLRLPGGGYRQRVDQVRAIREASAQVIIERGRQLAIPMRCLIWQGDPGEAIVEAAIAESVDLIVVGSHGRTGMDRLFMGSVSERVVRTSPLPVLVARSTTA